MKNIKKNAFTLVELLVVITILAIISVVAYQNFWGAVDKAVSGRKISDVSTIETSLQQYKVDKNYYPKTWEYSSSNLWWYNKLKTATQSNKVVVVYNGEAIASLSWTVSIWWWKVYGSWSLWQIWAKWTISIKQLTKKYLSKDLYDPELWDVKINGSTKMIEQWIWRYVYATYKKSPNWSSVNQSWIAYNIAYTIKKQWSDKYITKIVWDYDAESCYADKANCPDTLIWTLSWSTDKTVLLDWSEISNTNNSAKDNYWIPYAVTDFAQ